MDENAVSDIGASKVADLMLVRQEEALVMEGTDGTEVPAAIPLVNRKGDVVGTYTLNLAAEARQAPTVGTGYAQLQGMNINVGQLLG